MVESGMIDEAKQFYPFRHLNAMKTVGFRELFSWLDGDFTQEEAIEKIKINTRRYAKRQLTWLRKDPDIHWVQPGERALMEKKTDAFLTGLA
jgi:tRNA dimethylallyltransferase